MHTIIHSNDTSHLYLRTITLHQWTITSTPVDHHIYTRGPSHPNTRGPSHLHPWTITSKHPWIITSTPITCTMLTQFKCSWKLYFCPHITYMFQPRAHAEALCIVFHVKSVLCQKYSYHFVGTLKQHIPL